MIAIDRGASARIRYACDQERGAHGTRVRCLELPCDSSAPGSVRDALREFEDAGWIVGDAMLVASELVSNAVLHSGGCEGDMLKVLLRLGQGRLLISVGDPGLSGTTATRRSHEDPFGGIGLRLVEQLSERWGVDRAEGHRVWAELALS